MQRIFYYSGYRLTVFHWQGEQLLASYAFNPGEDGFEKFRTYLLATENSPARILVDLIEEDFNKESIPHVGANDRKSIVQRIVDRQYRQSRDFFYATIIGRESHGRKDDLLLYSVLSNPEIIEPWLNIMHDTGTSVSGIWSLPLISHHLVKKLEDTSQNIILVTQQVPSNLRQSFYKNNRFQTSRSAVLNLAEASIGEHIATEVEQTIRFLSNQRQIGFDEIIEVHIVCQVSDFEDIKAHCTDTSILHHHYHKLPDIEKSLKCSTLDSDYCSGIFSFICASEKIPVGHYGSTVTFFKFYEYLASRAIYIASTLIFILSTILSFSYISKSTILDVETGSYKDKTSTINATYQKTLAPLETELAQAEMMKSSVLFTRKVISVKSTSPQNFMLDISQALNTPDISGAYITTIKWQLNQSNDIPLALPSKPSQLIDYANIFPVNQVASISGFLPVSSSSLQQSVRTTHAISSALQDNNRTLKFIIDKIPVDVRPESTLENESGTSKRSSLSSDQSNGKFQIKLLMKGRDS